MSIIFFIYVLVPTLPSGPSMCSLFGFSSIKTFDSKYYSFHGDCSYKVAGDCVDDSFSVHYHQKKKCAQSAQCERNVTLYASGTEIKLFNTNQILINKEKVTVPYTSPNFAIDHLKGTDYLSITGMRGLSILWNGFSLDVQLLASLANRTCGLCGNFNGSPRDDFILNADGDVAASSQEFARHWKRLQFGEKCSDRNELFSGTFVNRYSSAQQQNDPAAHIANDGLNTVDQRSKLCHEFMTHPDFKQCRSSVPVQQYQNICLNDCKNGLDNCSCNAYQQFAQACPAFNNVDGSRWKILKKCRKSSFYSMLSSLRQSLWTTRLKNSNQFSTKCIV